MENRNCVLKKTNRYDTYTDIKGKLYFDGNKAPRYTYEEGINALKKMSCVEVLVVFTQTRELKAMFVGGRYNGMTYSVTELYEQTDKFTDDLTKIRKLGGMCHRKELDNQPIIEGYLSPMWDGDKLRYETQEVYNRMSK
jgi:hypothetical protein